MREIQQRRRKKITDGNLVDGAACLYIVGCNMRNALQKRTIRAFSAAKKRIEHVGSGFVHPAMLYALPRSMIGRSCRRRRFVVIAMLMACWSLTVKRSCLSLQSITKRTLYQTMQIPAAVPAQRRGEKENLQCAFRPENAGIYQ